MSVSPASVRDTTDMRPSAADTDMRDSFFFGLPPLAVVNVLVEVVDDADSEKFKTCAIS